MTGMSAGEPHELWPPDLFERAAAVLAFIAGHVLVQDGLDPAGERDIAQWIALISADVGCACAAIAERPADADAERVAAAWLACAGADALARAAGVRAREPGRADRRSARSPGQRADVRARVAAGDPDRVRGRGARPARRRGRADHDRRPRRPRPRAALPASAHRGARRDASRAAESAERADTEAPPEPVQDTLWALEETAHTAAGAAVLLHPGGTLGMPKDTA